MNSNSNKTQTDFNDKRCVTNATEIEIISDESTENKSESRVQWARQIEFVLSCIGYSVGLGNVWRFPYLCLTYGGGAFLVPYLLYLTVCGMSLFLMETAIGQSTGLSTVRIFNMIPFFQGLGWCMVFASGILSIYYNILIAYCLYFFGMSFHWVLPWSTCDNAWNTPSCYEHNGQDRNSTNATFGFILNETESILTHSSYSLPKRTAAEEFWRFNVLEISDNINNFNGIQWKLMLALIAAWVITFVCMYRGIRSTGKVVYVTATAPYFLLTVILIRGCTLPGAWNGLKLYIMPNWSRLADLEIWVAAATQIFYSLGPAWGGLITFASYNRYDHNILRDAVILPLICGGTSIYGGFAIFSVIGHLMYVTGQNDTSQLTLQGPGLAFVAYPQALTQLPGAAIWSVLFFLMLLTLGIDSQFATLEAVVTGLIDRFPHIVGDRKAFFTFLVCLVEFALGFVLATRAGFHYFQLLDTYATAFSVVVIGFIESLVISYSYGARRLLNDIEWMIGPMRRSTRYWWTLAWCVLIPLMTLGIIVSTFVDHVAMAEEKRKLFPIWAITLGWTISCMSFIQLPLLAVYSVYQHGFHWRKLFLPSEEWQITVEKHRETSLATNNASQIVNDGKTSPHLS